MKRRYGEPAVNEYDSEEELNRRGAGKRDDASHFQQHGALA
jgi:hypothetical protein